MKKAALIISLTLFASSFLIKASSEGPLVYITHFLKEKNGIVFGYQTIPDYIYSVEVSTNGLNWNSVTNFTATGYAASHYFPYKTNGMELFRIKRTSK